MTQPYDSTLQNYAIVPNQLVQGVASTYNTIPCSTFTLVGQTTTVKYLSRIVLQTTLTYQDMVGGNGGAYWNSSAVPATQAPFYLFLGPPTPANMVDLTMIGNINVGEQLYPIKIPPGTDINGVWLGVIAASAPKCEATVCFTDSSGR